MKIPKTRFEVFFCTYQDVQSVLGNLISFDVDESWFYITSDVEMVISPKKLTNIIQNTGFKKNSNYFAKIDFVNVTLSLVPRPQSIPL